MVQSRDIGRYAVRNWHVPPNEVSGEKLRDDSTPIGKLKGSEIQGGTATGPAADVSVAAGGEADVAIAISFPKEFPATPKLLLGAVGPLPTGIVIGDLERTALSKTGATITLRVYNHTAAAVTVTAGSVSLDWLAVYLG